MDQSFNDKELSDIMKEIEALEEDFGSPAEKHPDTVLDELSQLEEPVSPPVASKGNLLSIGQTRSEAVSSDSFSTSQSYSVPHETSSPERITKSSEANLTLNIQGSMHLNLQFEMSGKTVSLAINECELCIEMEGGMKFTIPVLEDSTHKKAI